jgi:AcrR family transcriptional regulator
VPTARRSQEERARSTRSALTSAARALFAERGYAAVPAEEITRRAGVTRGALYHHYGDKQELFREVFEQLETEVTAEIAAAARQAPDRASGMVAALTAFLDICQRPEVVRIGLTDAPAVLGWAGWREIESRHGLGLVVELLESAAAGGLLAPEAVPALAQLVLSAIIEAALMIAHAADREAAREQAWQALLVLLAGTMTP